MPVVLVHGVPDTSRMWDPLVAALGRDDVVALALPGFGTAVPDGFACTKEAYAGWVADQVAGLDGPVDLVGHDWGSLLTQRVALTRPTLLRSFVMADAAVTDAFAWHDLAVAWQTPDVGEQVMEAMAGDALSSALTDAGHPDGTGAATHIDETMKACVLALYRSAVDVAREWAPTRPAERPGFLLWGRDDPYAPPGSGERFADVAGTRIEILDAGHWAIVERPTEAAALLEEFWSSLPSE